MAQIDSFRVTYNTPLPPLVSDQELVASEPPSIPAPSLSDPSKSNSKPAPPPDSGSGLGVAQIVITAATPCLDDSGEKAFPPPPPPVRSSGSQDEEELPPPPPDEGVASPDSAPPNVPPPAPPSVSITGYENVFSNCLFTFLLDRLSCTYTIKYTETYKQRAI